jgi:hypothetical protein
VQAIWLAETGQDLRGSLTDVLDVGGGQPTLELLPEVRERLGWIALTRDSGSSTPSCPASMRRHG